MTQAQGLEQGPDAVMDMHRQHRKREDIEKTVAGAAKQGDNSFGDRNVPRAKGKAEDVDNGKRQDQKAGVGHGARGKGQRPPDAMGVSGQGMSGDPDRYSIRGWSCLPVLVEEEQAGGNMDHEEGQKPNPEDAQNEHVAVYLLRIALKSRAAQIEGGDTGDMAAEKEEQQQAAYGHEPFFANGRDEKSDKPHGYLSWMEDGQKR